MAFGITIKHDTGGKRVELQCEHQNGLLYVAPGEANWVCAEEYLHAHSLAGFFSELVRIRNPEVRDLMQRWGIYFRDRGTGHTGEP